MEHSHTLVPNAKFRIQPGADHLTMISAPENARTLLEELVRASSTAAETAA